MKKLFSKVRNNQFLREFFRFYKEADSELSSVAVAYYWLISVFPLLLIVVNILPYFHIPVADFLTAIKDMLPETLYDVVAKVMREVLTQPSTGLLSFSVLSALWTFSKSMNFLQIAFNKAYGVAMSDFSSRHESLCESWSADSLCLDPLSDHVRPYVAGFPPYLLEAR